MPARSRTPQPIMDIPFARTPQGFSGRSKNTRWQRRSIRRLLPLPLRKRSDGECPNDESEDSASSNSPMNIPASSNSWGDRSSRLQGSRQSSWTSTTAGSMRDNADIPESPRYAFDSNEDRIEFWLKSSAGVGGTECDLAPQPWPVTPSDRQQAADYSCYLAKAEGRSMDWLTCLEYVTGQRDETIPTLLASKEGIGGSL